MAAWQCLGNRKMNKRETNDGGGELVVNTRSRSPDACRVASWPCWLLPLCVAGVVAAGCHRGESAGGAGFGVCTDQSPRTLRIRLD